MLEKLHCAASVCVCECECECANGDECVSEWVKHLMGQAKGVAKRGCKRMRLLYYCHCFHGLGNGAATWSSYPRKRLGICCIPLQKSSKSHINWYIIEWDDRVYFNKRINHSAGKTYITLGSLFWCRITITK